MKKLNCTQQAIWNESLKVLSEIGFKVVDERILAKLKEANFKIDGTTVYFTEEQIIDAIDAAPSSFTLKARNPEKSITLGEGTTKIASGYGCSFIIEPDGTRRNGVYDDFLNLVRLVHESGQVNTNGGILMQPSDLHKSVCFPAMLYAALTLSDMPLMGISAHESEVRSCMELAEIAFGGAESFRSDYRILSIVNILSPLTLGDHAEQTLWVAAEYNQPVIITPGVNSGGTAPVTPSGLIVQGNAEILAAITIVQTLRRGLPCVYGLNASIIDMNTASYCLSSPLSEQVRTMARSLAVAYELPSRNGGAYTDGRKVGLQTSIHSAMCIQNSIKENASISVHATGVLDSMLSISYEKFMMDCEIIRHVRKSIEPLCVDEDVMGFEDIKDVGIGGNYLSSPHTVEYFREYSFEPAFCAPVDVLAENPADADINFITRVQNLRQAWMDRYKTPEFDCEIKAKMEDYLLNVIKLDEATLNKAKACVK